MSISSLSEKSSLQSLRLASPAPSIESEPERLPLTLEGPMVWESDQLNPKSYILELEQSEIERVRAAVLGFKLLQLPRGAINTQTFALPFDLAHKLSGLSSQVHLGPGIAVLRGLDAARFNDEEAVIAFAGISSYVCPNRATDAYANQTLSHVRDATHDVVPTWAKELGLAGSKLPSAMEFHCDRFSGDVLALHVRNDGAIDGGGEQFVASFWKIYNELLSTNPAALETLAAPEWPFELKHPATKISYLEYGPALFFAQNKPICQLVRAPLLGSPRIPRSNTMPSLSKEQEHALQAVENLARRYCTQVDRRNGDIQFINNLGIMHARAAYGINASHRRSHRHLLRMFLRDPEHAWVKPLSYQKRFDDPFEQGREQNLPIVDMDPWRKISGRESHG